MPTANRLCLVQSCAKRANYAVASAPRIPTHCAEHAHALKETTVRVNAAQCKAIFCTKIPLYRLAGTTHAATHCHLHRTRFMLRAVKTTQQDLKLFTDDLLFTLHEHVRKGNMDMAYEYAAAYHLTNLYHRPIFVWHDLPTTVKDRLGLPNMDVGLDLVALDCSLSGQVKHYLKTSYVKAKDMNRSYLCVLKACRHTQNGQTLQPLIFVTPEHTKLGNTRIAFNLKTKHTILTKDAFRKLKTLAAKRHAYLSALWNKPEQRHTNLRPWQMEALDTLAQNDSNRQNVRVACGAGKSHLVLQHFQKIKSSRKKALVLVPTCVLLRQWTTMIRLTKLSVARVGDGWVEDPITHDVTIAVYNSIEKLTDTLSYFTHCYIDEAHHVQRRLIKLMDDTVLELSDSEDDNDNDYGLKKTYLTQLANLVLSSTIPRTMLLSATLKNDEPGTKNILTYTYGLDRAIQDGILCNYQIHNPVYVANSSQPDLITYFQQHQEFSHVLAYFNRIDHAKAWAKQAQTRGLNAVALTSDMTKANQIKTLEHYRQGNIRILATVNILGEGVNLPIANTCCFAEPRHSPYSIIQCMGRVLREFPGKRMAYVILPGRLHTGMDDLHLYTHALAGFYKTLAKHDAELKACIIERKQTARIVVNAPKEMEELATLLYERIMDANGQVLQRGDIEFYCKLYKAYVAKFKKAPSFSTVYCNVKLGIWINTQRTNYKKNKLDAAVAQTLEALPEWSWDPRADQFNAKVALYKAYVAKFKKAPIQSTVYCNVKLGNWVNNQRQNYKNNKLDAVVAQRLEALPEWSWDPLADQFNANVTLYKAYVAEFKKAPGCSTIYCNVKLGSWINTQRQNYKKNNLDAAAVRALEALPFWLWDPYADQFNAKVALYKAYVAEFKKAPTNSTVYCNVKLGRWVDWLRQKYKKNKLDAAVAQTLEALPEWSWGSRRPKRKATTEPDDAQPAKRFK